MTNYYLMIFATVDWMAFNCFGMFDNVTVRKQTNPILKILVLDLNLDLDFEFAFDFDLQQVNVTF